MLIADRTYSADELERMLRETKATEAGRDLALKDATQIYHNGPLSGENVHRAAGNLAKLRALNADRTPLEVNETTLIPRGAMLYFAADNLFAFGCEPKERLPLPE